MGAGATLNHYSGADVPLEQYLDLMLLEYGLSVPPSSPAAGCSSTPHLEGGDLGAATPVSFAFHTGLIGREQSSVANSDHNYPLAEAHGVVSIAAETFVLPRDVDRRFHSLVNTYNLRVISFGKKEEHRTKEGSSGEESAGGSKGVKSRSKGRVRPSSAPSWMIWTTLVPCDEVEDI